MASPAEAMKWHTERFLNGGPGASVDAYPKVDENGKVTWYTFSDGKPTSSPLGITSHSPQVATPDAPLRFRRNRLSRMQYSGPLYEQPDFDRGIDPPSLEELIGEQLCSMACDGTAGCSGAYGYSEEEGTAICAEIPRHINVPSSVYDYAYRASLANY
jgi:hypothetical protein